MRARTAARCTSAIVKENLAAAVTRVPECRYSNFKNFSRILRILRRDGLKEICCMLLKNVFVDLLKMNFLEYVGSAENDGSIGNSGLRFVC